MEVSEAITRKSASNLALAFILLPKEKRQAMAALYAFCREVDDIADDEGGSIEGRSARLNLWREDIRTACSQGQPRLSVVQELQPFVEKYQLPFALFDELICGVEMDLRIHDYPDFPALEQYCYRVASVVGLLSIEIFGYKDPGCRQYAIHLGKALQLTNILRDVRNDAERGRIYIPAEERQQFGVSSNEIFQFQYSSRFYELAKDMAGKARHFYQQARDTLPPADRSSMATAELMGSVYWRLLQKLERRRFNVFDASVTRLNRLQKLLLVGRVWYGVWRGALTPGYGVC